MNRKHWRRSPKNPEPASRYIKARSFTEPESTGVLDPIRDRTCLRPDRGDAAFVKRPGRSGQPLSGKRYPQRYERPRRVGLPFAPNGRVFREWTAVSVPDEKQWRALLQEAKGFVDG